MFAKKTDLLLKPKKQLWLSTFIYAIIVAAIFFVPFIIKDRGYFIFYGDFNAQQIPFYQMCHDMVRSGNFGWNYYTDLGVNFIGSYSFYLLGSPFFWLTIPFPSFMVPYLMGPLLILKFGCAALTAYFFLRRFTKTPEAARLGGLLYAFCGFSIYNIFFNHFHEAIIVFPLLLLSLELFIVDKRRGPFAFIVFVCAFTNYFFFFGMVVFVIIYWFVRVLSRSWKMNIKELALLIFEAVIGLLCAGVLLYPSILAIIGNDRLTNFNYGWNNWIYYRKQIFYNVLEVFFFPPDCPARPVFFDYADVQWASLGGWLPVFSMVGFVAFWQSKKGHWLRRMLGICALFALVPILNSAFSMFNAAYYARWYFMPILLIVLMTVNVAENKEIKLWSAYRWVAGITFAATLIIGFSPNDYEDGKIGRLGLFTNGFRKIFFITCAIAIASLALLGLIIKLFRKDTKKFLRVSTAAVCIVTVIYSTFFIFTGKKYDYKQEIIIDHLIEGKVDLPGNPDSYRIDSFESVDNTGMYLGLQSINAFHSIVPPSITDFYTFVGENRGVGSRPETDNYAIRSLLSVKYFLNDSLLESFVDEDGKTKMPGYKYYKDQSGFYIYENENYIPMGFTYDYYMTRDQCKEYGVENRGSMMLKAILLDDKQAKKYGDIIDNIDEKYDSPFIVSDEDANEITNEDAKENDALKIEDSKESVENDTEEEIFDSQTVQELATEDVTIAEKICENTKQTVSFTPEIFAEDCKALKKNSCDNFSYNKNGFKAKYNAKKDNLIFFSVPYDEGWTATVNGKKAEIEKVNIGFMAVKVSSGENNIVFTYKTPGLMLGACISAGSFAVLIAYWIIASLIRKRNGINAASVGKSDIDFGYKDCEKESNIFDDLEIDFSVESDVNDGEKENEAPAENLPKKQRNNYENSVEGGFVINGDFLKNLPDFDADKKD